ncbi:MAG: hypothetical protein HC866_03470 [Leptolyngbyaceae cyanobacterium RU_5_1]|nr:hypothetical protein [Leptolyngbyaceae cyanobacterium RU_5_1]
MIIVFPKQIVRYLFTIAVVLDGLSFLVQLPRYALGYALPQKIVDFFNIGGEYNPQAWYSSLLLVLCSLLLLLIAAEERRLFSNTTGYWYGLSFVFFYLASDEMLLLHERASELLSPHIHAVGIFRYAWVVIAIPICLILGVVFLKFLLNLPQRIRTLFFVSAGLYLGGALILEMIEGAVASLYGEGSIFDFLLVAIEEFLEKLGTILFIYALLTHIRLSIKSIQIEIR